MDEPTLTITEVADQTGVNPSAIRYYERVGVLPKPDRLGGHRRYTAETVRRLQVIDLAKRSGFTLDQVKELLTSDRPRDVLSAMAERKLPAVQALAERTTALQASTGESDSDFDAESEEDRLNDWCSRFAESIEQITAGPKGPPDQT